MLENSHPKTNAPPIQSVLSTNYCIFSHIMNSLYDNEIYLIQKCKLSPPGVISCQTIAIVNNEIYLFREKSGEMCFNLCQIRYHSKLHDKSKAHEK